MPRPIEFNDYITEGNITIIKLNHKPNILWAIIDTEDLPKLIDLEYRWCARYRKYLDDYYVQCNTYFGGVHKTFTLHQFVLNYFEKSGIDHINGDTLDNRKSNLRISDKRQNHQNRKSKNANNKTGYRNVCFIKGKYVVTLQIDGKQKTLGRFDDVDKAGAFAEEMRQDHYKDWAGNN